MNNNLNKYLFALGVLIFITSNVKADIDQYAINYNIPLHPSIIFWMNNKTNDSSLNITININEVIKFNISADQAIDTWTWSKDDIIQNNNYDNFTTSWTTAGNKVLSVNGSNSNGITNTIIWNINVLSGSIPINSCSTLNKPNSSYVLNSDFASRNTCIFIGANNVTLDGQGHTINYAGIYTGYGIYGVGYRNITIGNVNLVQSNASVVSAHGIYFDNMTNSNENSIAISTSGSNNHGIYIVNSKSNIFTGLNITTSGNTSVGIFEDTKSDSNIYSGKIITSGIGAYGIYINGNKNNNFSNINVNTIGSGAYGVYLNAGGYNNFIGGSIISNLGIDYYLQNIGVTNSFINTNFTARKIYLTDNLSSFNYSDGTIWLNTSQNVSPTSSIGITRNITGWASTNVSWQETLSSNRQIIYGMSGLTPSANYTIWNGSAIAYNLSADNNGNLPSFYINFTKSMTTIRILRNS